MAQRTDREGAQLPGEVSRNRQRGVWEHEECGTGSRELGGRRCRQTVGEQKTSEGGRGARAGGRTAGREGSREDEAGENLAGRTWSGE